MCQQAVQQVKQCMVLNCFSSAMWAVMMVSEADETNPNAFNWEFASGKVEMYKKSAQALGIDQI